MCFSINTESEESVLADLKWLGLDWDEGPDIEQHIANYGPYRQSERSEIYLSAVRRLVDTGNAYYCFTTQEELDEMKAQQEAAGQIFKYDGRWRDADPELVNKMIDQEKPFTVRFKVQPGSRVVIDDIVRGTVSWDAEANVGDFILLRSTGVPVYNFCVAVDDAAMGVATVVRAEEHLTNTLRQALILDALGAPRPRYAHCSLILGEDKQKLSKRHGATSCDQYRLDGFLPDAMINYLALLGWSDGTENEIFTREELIDAFDLNRVNKSPSVFDIEKLKWVNGQHIKMLTVSNLIPYVKDQFVLDNLLKDDVTLDNQQLHDLAFASTSIAKQMMLTTKDAVTNAKTVFSYNLPKSYDTIEDKEAKEMIEQGTFYVLAKKILEQYDSGVLPLPSSTDALAAFQDASGEAIEEDDKKGETCEYTHNYISHMKSLAKEMKIKGKLFFHPIRLMLTGEMSGQDVTKQMSLLALATGDNSVVDKKKAGVVSLSKRMDRLRTFIDTIPEQYRQPQTAEQVAAAAAQTLNNKEVVNGASASTSEAATTAHAAAAVVDPKDTYTGPRISSLDIRVGRITKVWEHEDADKLFCEEIDVGEDQPRMVASGLRPYMSATDLDNRLVLVLCNLKERKFSGFPSHGMVLCASNSDHTQVTLVNPPINAKIGERITIPDMEFTSQNVEDYEPFGENQIAKKKVFESIAPHLITNKYGVPEFLGRPFMTSAGICTSSIPDGSVS
jgi:glutamyl-tRNA synthetase